MSQQQKDQQQSSQSQTRMTEPRDEERQVSFRVVEQGDDENPYICRGVD